MAEKKIQRSVDKELKQEILWTLDDLHLVSPTKVVTNSKGEQVEIPDKEYEALVDKLDKLLGKEMERRKQNNTKLQIIFMAGVPILIIATGWGARVLVQSPYWKDIVRCVEKLMVFRC